MSWHHGLLFECDVHGEHQLTVLVLFEWSLSGGRHCGLLPDVHGHRGLLLSTDVHGQHQLAVHLVRSEHVPASRHSGQLSRCSGFVSEDGFDMLWVFV